MKICEIKQAESITFKRICDILTCCVVIQSKSLDLKCTLQLIHPFVCHLKAHLISDSCLVIHIIIIYYFLANKDSNFEHSVHLLAKNII